MVQAVAPWLSAVAPLPPALVFDAAAMDAPATPATALEGRVLGRTYRILRRLDEGGMGVVFEAEHVRLRRRVAVKVLLPRLASTPAMVARFHQEAEIVSRLDHPHIVSAIDFDVDEAHGPYLVLELLHGVTLEERLGSGTPLPIEEAVEIVLQLASALAAAHRACVVHRDVKPANVFLTHAPGELPFVKLLDFGISKDLRSRRTTQTNLIIGTPDYMSPEQAAGRHELVDERADQCALAVVAYEMLTGHRPFSHEEPSETMTRVASMDAPPASSVAPWIPHEVDAVLARGLSKDPEARHANVLEFARALAAAARGSSAAPSAAPPERAARACVGDGAPHARTMPSIAPPPSSGVARSSSPSSREGRLAPRAAEVKTAVVQEESLPEPVAPAGNDDALHRIMGCIERARAALDARSFAEAAAHAEVALRHADDSSDRAVSELIRLSEPLLGRIFMLRLGSPASRIEVSAEAPSREAPLSPRAAFVMSRVTFGISLGELLDVAALPPLSALRSVVQLVSCGALRTA